MKIKYWLMISYLIVMVLPVMTLYFLYISIHSYHEKQDITEFMEFSNRLKEMEPILEKPSLYSYQTVERYEKQLAPYASDKLKINLYMPDGRMLYSTLDDPSIYRYIQYNVDKLYKDLNSILKKHRTYSFKKPVFHGETIIGIYEVVVSRDEWIDGVNHRTTKLIGLMIGFFIILYTIVVIMLNRKLNKPLTMLQLQMSSFAKGEKPQLSIKQKNDEIGELIAHFNRMKAEIEQTQLELKSQQKEKEYIVASLSHDLKTPLTVIQAYSEALLDESKLSNTERSEYKTIVFEKLRYMKQMLDDLTIYTTLQTSEEKTEFVEVDGEEFFDMLLSGYEESCSKKDIQLVVEKSVSAAYEVNVNQCIRIVDNIMGNAIRHTMNGEKIWLAVYSKESQLPQWIFKPFKQHLDHWRKGGTIIIIQNIGEAIPLARQDELFEPFKQVEAARGQGGSSGLGLSIAKMLIEKHEGKIHLWSQEGCGTLVACWIKEKVV
ncbi:two-component sensor histidine kinase [Bacillus sp. 7586-K]|uniref:HAMP domain-containing sensor histidine kinase n=1 Tax=Metabacillus niabensis TaxID=324854 RepID=UPI000BA6AE90|nr:two-component sensor histidine kinase [Bacillus sp. 7586-K]